MRRKCFVKYCGSKSYGDIQSNVTFHLFPKDENIIEKFKLLSNRIETAFSNVEDIKITKSSYISNEHFKPGFFFPRKDNGYQDYRRLKRDEVPTIFINKVPTLSQQDGFQRVLHIPQRKL
ncbi:Uncharacterized protein APZ42_014687 [Daphnia magna]|uniref:THAP-type domain-containing protein n=1 Tax=Daphnia magna TaxID=35525 RepID=A0A162PNU8_9CRUS|nr:Uncharacterized protein APZ42_014687 [Daphnia magna]